MALKLEAFEDRGQKDFLCSTDFEDVICLFNGRSTIADEILANPGLRQCLAAKFKDYLASTVLEDAVEGFVQTENNPDARKERILDAFRQIAESGK